LDVVDSEGDAGQSFALRRERIPKTFGHRSHAGRCDQLDRDVGEAERRHLEIAVLGLCAPGGCAAQQGRVRCHPRVDVADGDDDMIEPGDHLVTMTSIDVSWRRTTITTWSNVVIFSWRSRRPARARAGATMTT